MFHVEARVQLKHDDREIEFHDFLSFCKGSIQQKELKEISCEMIAKNLLQGIKKQYGLSRTVWVSVYEDGEVGAIVEN